MAFKVEEFKEAIGNFGRPYLFEVNTGVQDDTRMRYTCRKVDMTIGPNSERLVFEFINDENYKSLKEVTECLELDQWQITSFTGDGDVAENLIIELKDYDYELQKTFDWSINEDNAVDCFKIILTRKKQ